MKSKVYFTDFRAKSGENLFQKLVRLIETAGMYDTFEERDIVAVKLHFGAPGNVAYIRPIYIAKIVQAVKEKGGLPFITDTTTLSEEYPGRGYIPGHNEIAVQHGFAYSVVGAPVVIADGVRGLSEVAIPINQKRFKQVSVAAEIANADTLISVAHFKLHEGAGFGGAIKNMAIGCTTQGAKLRQHSDRPPVILKENCKASGRCVTHCPTGALSIVDGVVTRDEAKCTMCAMCYGSCPNNAFDVKWISAYEDPPFYHESKMEHALGVLKSKAEGKAFFINFINHISPNCDCYGHNDAPIVRDIGIAASTDPLAIDQASLDLMNQERGIPGTALQTNLEPGGDKIKGVYPDHTYEIQLPYAQEIGIGNREYELITV